MNLGIKGKNIVQKLDARMRFKKSYPHLQGFGGIKILLLCVDNEISLHQDLCIDPVYAIIGVMYSHKMGDAIGDLLRELAFLQKLTG